MHKDWKIQRWIQTYVSLKQGKAYAPDEIKDKSICINWELKEMLTEL